MCGAVSKSGSPSVRRTTSTPRSFARAMSSPIRKAFSVPREATRAAMTLIGPSGAGGRGRRPGGSLRARRGARAGRSSWRSRPPPRPARSTGRGRMLSDRPRAEKRGRGGRPPLPGEPLLRGEGLRLLPQGGGRDEVQLLIDVPVVPEPGPNLAPLLAARPDPADQVLEDAAVADRVGIPGARRVDRPDHPREDDLGLGAGRERRQLGPGLEDRLDSRRADAPPEEEPDHRRQVGPDREEGGGVREVRALVRLDRLEHALDPAARAPLVRAEKELLLQGERLV